MDERTIKVFLRDQIGELFQCPKCFDHALEVINKSGTTFHCKKPRGCGQRMTVRDYVELYVKNARPQFDFFEEVFLLIKKGGYF